MSNLIDVTGTFHSDKHKNIDDYMKLSIKEDNVEFEVVYGDLGDKSKFLSKQQFLDLKEYLTTQSEYVNKGESESLDIKTEYKNKYKSFPSSLRLSIEGISQIKKYCKHDLLEELDYTIINKLKYTDPKNPSLKFDSLNSKEYPCRVNLKKESPVDKYSKEGSIFTNNWPTKNKSFRYKKRYSFLTKNKLWRIDLTAVKQTKGGEYFKTFKSSNLLRNKEIFELEIEYVGNNDLDNLCSYSGNPVLINAPKTIVA